jgi:predicted dehydrogenase
MERAREIVETARDSGKVHAVMQNRRFDPNLWRVCRFLENGGMGPLTTLNSDFYIGAHFGGFRDRMKHVLLLDMAIHTFDTARKIVGADPLSVYCKEWNPQGSWYDHGASAIAVFQMEGNVVYTYRGSWCSEGLNTAWESSWHAVGQEGSLKWNGADGIETQVVKKTGGFFSECEAVDIPPWSGDSEPQGHAALIQDFFCCLSRGVGSETRSEDNIKSLAMVFAAIESARTGQPVAIQ